MHDRTRNLLLGTLAGFAATLPMTAVMTLWHRRLPWSQREPLPPRKITEQMLDVLQIEDNLSEPDIRVLTTTSHFGYGAAMGGLFAMIPPAPTLAGAVSSGMVYGLGVWTGSYLGWLPAMGLHRSAIDEPTQRNMLMLASHLVWGGSTGALIHWLRKPPVEARGDNAGPAAPRVVGSARLGPATQHTAAARS